jgi:hypothetical protein
VPNKKLTAEQTEEFKAEIRIMSKLFNPRIALFMGAYIPEVRGAGVVIGVFARTEPARRLTESRW